MSQSRPADSLVVTYMSELTTTVAATLTTCGQRVALNGFGVCWR